MDNLTYAEMKTLIDEIRDILYMSVQNHNRDPLELDEVLSELSRFGCRDIAPNIRRMYDRVISAEHP